MTDTQLDNLATELENLWRHQNSLGGYSADANVLCRLLDASATLTVEVLSLRKEIRKLKRVRR